MQLFPDMLTISSISWPVSPAWSNWGISRTCVDPSRPRCAPRTWSLRRCSADPPRGSSRWWSPPGSCTAPKRNPADLRWKRDISCCKHGHGQWHPSKFLGPDMLYPKGPNFFRSNIKLWKWHRANRMDLKQPNKNQLVWGQSIHPITHPYWLSAITCTFRHACPFILSFLYVLVAPLDFAVALIKLLPVEECEGSPKKVRSSCKLDALRSQIGWASSLIFIKS